MEERNDTKQGPAAGGVDVVVTTDRRAKAAKKPASMRIDLVNDAITPSMWIFALPMIFSFMINAIYTMVDLYFVSKLGTDATAALGWGDFIFFLLFTIMSGFAMGTGIVVARRVGEGDWRKVSETALQAVVSMGCLAFAVAIVLFFTIEYLLAFLNMTDKVRELTTLYISAIIIGVPFNFLFFQLSSIYRSTGNSIFPMILLIVAAVCNAVLDPFLIFGIGPFPELGILGAGISTVVAQVVSAGLGLLVLFWGKAGIKIDFRIPRPDFGIIATITRLGIPSSLQMFSVSISRLLLLQLAGGFGASVTAGFFIGTRIDFFAWMPIFAMGVMIQTVTGQHLGAGKVKRVYQYFNASFWQTLLVVGVLGAIAYIFAAPIADIFVPETSVGDPAVVGYTSEYLSIAVFAYPFFLLGIISTRLLSGAGMTFRSMLIVSGSLFLIQVPLCYALSTWTELQQNGIWLGIFVGYVLFSLIAYASVRTNSWMRVKNV